MTKIVILGDSLALPRNDLSIESTYPYMLQKKLKNNYFLFRHSRRANDTNIQIQNMHEDVGLYHPDIVIIHLGIVDCAPRLFYRGERKIIAIINKIIPIVNILSRYRFQLTKLFPKVYVNLKRFEDNMRKITAYLLDRDIKVIIVNIADTTVSNKSINFNYEKNIKEYNRVLENSAKKSKNIHLVDMFKQGEDILLEDGIHLNHKGSTLLADALLHSINGIA